MVHKHVKNVQIMCDCDTTDGMSGYISQQALSSSLLPLLLEDLIDLLIHHVFG